MAPSPAIGALLMLATVLLLQTAVDADIDNPVTRRFKCQKNGCCDQHEWCRFWASVGECRTNDEWMEDNCQLACSTCNKKVTRKPNPLRASPRPPTNRPTSTTSTTRRTTATQTTRRPTTTVTTTSRRPVSTTPPRSPLAECEEIRRAHASDAAAQLIRKGLVFPREDFSGRRPMNVDQVILSNTAHQCVPRLDEAECSRSLCYNLYYRTFDGTCNNLAHPLQGAAFRPYNRLLPTIYDDGLKEPVGMLNKGARPSPRHVSRNLLSTRASVLHGEFNAMLMQYGQFLSHDMAKTTLIPSSKCSSCVNSTNFCMAVRVENDDPNANFRRDRCLRVSRSSPICGSGRRLPRQQLNENTGYIDLSPVYGSSLHDTEKLRDGSTPFLKLPSFHGTQNLPFDQSTCRARGTCKAIFRAGDSRVNLFVGLASLQLIYAREHNRVARTLRQLNPHWTADRLYMESRKIVGAEHQAIVYREYLPKILGAAFQATIGEYRGYRPDVDATVANEFTSAAFRFGHGMIQEFYPRLDDRFRNTSFGAMQFVHGTLKSDTLLFEGGIDPVLRGLITQHAKRPQRMTTAITENMFGATDLATINIQRGRDHAHPSYSRYREVCGLGATRSFDDLKEQILLPEVRRKMQRIYGSVDRVDLFVGAILEDPVVRGLVGPTVACIIGPQFKRSRDGDRFYYENPGTFTHEQLAEIRKSSLSRILCDNADNIKVVPREAFRAGHLTPCASIPHMNLAKWKE